MSYKQEYAKSLSNPEEFWGDQAKALDWFKFPENIISTNEQGMQQWFADGEMNTCHMALDAQIEQGRGEQVALIYDSPVTDQKKQFTYSELRDEVAKTAGMIAELGVTKGDRVIIYMPMIPEAVIGMLACARLGAIHSVVFGGFAARELAIRIDDASPKLVLSASCGIEITKIIEYKPLLDEAIELSEHKPEHCIVYQRPQVQASMVAGRDIDWQQALASATAAPCTPVRGDDDLYILYTSGTTGKPKGVVRQNGGHAVALKYSMSAVYNIQPGEAFWAVSDIGWAVGHSYIVYGPLLHGATSVFYEGKPIMTPDAGAFWRVVEEYKIKGMFTAPTAYRAIKKEDPQGELVKNYDVSSLDCIYSAGERLDPATYDWLLEVVGVPVVDNWWQTETGWPVASNMRGIEPMPFKAGSATVPCPGYQIEILDQDGQQLGPNEQGDVAIKLPMPPSCLTTVWGDFERFQDGYLTAHPGYYNTGDGGFIDEDGYLFIMGRIDDVINVAGHRLSTGEMEEVIGHHESIAESAVVARDDELKGQMPVGFVVLKSDSEKTDEEVAAELIQRVRKDIGAVAAFKEVYVVARLPKTRSGKILRKTIRHILNGEDYVIPSTIEDVAVLDEIKQTTQT